MTFETTTERTTSDSYAADEVAGEPVFLELDEVEPATEPEAAAPGWFSRKRAKASEPPKPRGRKRAKKNLLPAIAVRPEDLAETLVFEPTLLQKISYLFRGSSIDPSGELVANPGFQRFRKFLAFAATGYGISLILHTFLTAALALIVIEAASSSSLSLLASHSTEDIEEFDEIDTSLEVAGGAEEQQLLPQMQVVDIKGPDAVAPTEPTEIQPINPSTGNGTGGNDGNGDGQRFAMPVSGKAITKGSFTVWTIPEDPEPGQNYHIIIQVKLPDRIKKYRRSDLSGTVIGTDGYRQYLPGVKRGYLPVKGNKAQVAIFVPAAASLVRDTIEVRSKILSEKQNLEIVF